MHKVITGFGQFHTNETSPSNSSKLLKSYANVGLAEIRKMVDSPCSVQKSNAQWIIPSSYPSRKFDEQVSHGEYSYLWADLDKKVESLERVQSVLVALMDCDFEMYTTSSAKLGQLKLRVLIPLAKPLNYEIWVMCQRHLNDALRNAGLEPDTVNERSAQLCYLPNKGAYYATITRRNDKYLNPSDSWLNSPNSYTERTECSDSTDVYRGEQKFTEVVASKCVTTFDYINLPTDCQPKGHGQRNGNVFTFARYLKRLYPNADFAYLRPIVLGWHKHFIEFIATKNFSETWTDFRRGWFSVRVPYGQGIESIINEINFDIPITQAFLDLGYGAKEFKLLLVCRRLQLSHGNKPFYISCRKAGELIGYHFTGAAKMLDSFVEDKILKVVMKADAVKATRYQYIWMHEIEGT